MNGRFFLAGGALAIIAVLCNVAGSRLANRGHWLPTLPTVASEVWDGVEQPMPDAYRAAYGGAQLASYEYTNGFEEKVQVEVIAPSTFDAYQEPRLFTNLPDFQRSAERVLPLPGTNQNVRATVWHYPPQKARFIVYSWLQDQRGRTNSNLSFDGRDLLARLRIGVDTALQPDPFCLVRLYARISPNDERGSITRQNLNQVALGLYKALRAQGQKALNLPESATLAPAALSTFRTGTDGQYLDDLNTTEETLTGKLLPLQPGNQWVLDMQVSQAAPSAKSGAKAPKALSIRDTMTVTNKALSGGEEGMVVDIVRSGKPFRREVYREDAEGVQLLAFGQSSKPLIAMTPSVPLVRYPLVVGTATHWEGQINVQGKVYPAVALSRVTRKEPVATRTGRFANAYRIDTVIRLKQARQDIQFPTIRWLVPAIGFVQRGYADKGLPAYGKLIENKLGATR